MKYKNISTQIQTLIGFGVIKPDGTIETQEKINNPNFKLVEKSREVRVKQNDRSKFNRETS